MRTALRWLSQLIAFLIVVIGGLYFFGSREPIDTTVSFVSASIGDDLDGYLTEREAAFGDLTPGVEKRIVWAGAPGEQTDLSVIYVHGFSATSEEIRPVPDKVAAALGANLFFTRLAGHGRPGEAMAEPSMNDWINDLAEAMEIGRRIGKRVIVITASTGGTLAIAGSVLDGVRDDMAGLVLISPNFGPADPMAELANWPLARRWVPAVAGEWREWQPHNAEQGVYWTTRYPTVAALPMMALVKHVRELDLSDITVPAFFIWSDADKVVTPDRTAAAFETWGGPKQKLIVDVTDEDDPSAHVIAGDILSPNQTEPVAGAIIAWAKGL